MGMTHQLKLSLELREAVSRQPGRPLTVEDDQTHLRYVLLPYALFERVQALFSDDRSPISETYAAQSAVAGAAGWDDPEMDLYDNYDAHRTQS